jgi:head-tail adaptor
MKAGILKEKIEIYEPVITTTDYGDTKTTWSLFYTTHAAVMHNGGSRGNENNEVFYSTNKTFIIRHYVPVVEKMRIKFEGKYYQITSIIPNKYFNDKEIQTQLVNE